MSAPSRATAISFRMPYRGTAGPGTLAHGHGVARAGTGRFCEAPGAGGAPSSPARGDK